jgi:hypothetical protein
MLTIPLSPSSVAAMTGQRVLDLCLYLLSSNLAARVFTQRPMRCE